MIYDFNKDMIVEENKNKINDKVEKILNKSKNENEIHMMSIILHFHIKRKKGKKQIKIIK
jgi:hypothetical protein